MPVSRKTIGRSLVLLLFASCAQDDEGLHETTITIQGVVTDNAGVSAPNLWVSIQGKTVVRTGPNGDFTIPEVSTPYDLTVSVPAFSVTTTFNGLTTASPRLAVPVRVGSPNGAFINGNVPVVPNHTTLVSFVGGGKSWSTVANATGGTRLNCPGSEWARRFTEN